MTEMTNIREVAKKLLTVTSLSGGVDDSLWDRTKRLAKSVELISNMPQITQRNMQVDRFSLISAAYFNYAALAYGRENPAQQSLSAVNVDCQTSADIAEKVLKGKVEPARIQKINRILVESSGNFTHMIEAMILSDARNLEEMGAAGLFNEIKSYAFTGKSVSGGLKTWQRKIEYQYWQARLEENFRFDQVRILAQQRLETAQSFMQQLKIEVETEDIKQTIETSTVA
ncbi:MAG: hypothetical protein H8D47_03600 [Planctomycetes bacterium]|nr:hypothetical protein [Planctomycetota bacterium]